MIGIGKKQALFFLAKIVMDKMNKVRKKYNAFGIRRRYAAKDGGTHVNCFGGASHLYAMNFLSRECRKVSIDEW